ncbi:MAG TPA: TPM domain-containing protein, partial [Candidatus Limnocylindrales bacterium]
MSHRRGIPGLIRASRVFALLAVASMVWAGAAMSSVRAADIPTLKGEVTDTSGVLTGSEGEIRDAVAQLLRDHHVQLWVLYVATTGDLPSTDFAVQTAQKNSLGADDALLVVAIDDRTDAIWLSNSLTTITAAERDQVISEDLEPALRSGDFAGAAVAAANGLGAAAATAGDGGLGGGGTGDGTGDGSGGTSFPDTTPGPAIDLTGPIAILLVAGGLFLVYRWVKSTTGIRRAAEERDRRTGQLARDANALLIATDERLRDARQEVDYVEAEFGDTEVAPLRAAIAAAQTDLRAAFEVRQRLDDSEPEDPPTREKMLAEIVERGKRAQAALDAETGRIQQLRDLERDAPGILDAMPARIAEVEQRLPASEAAMTQLGTYAASTAAPVTGNIAEARKGLDGARAATERGKTALTAKDARAAAHEARTAQEGVAGAAKLLDAIDKLLQSARDAQAKLPDVISGAQADLASARDAVRGATPAAGNAAPNAAALAAAEKSL